VKVSEACTNCYAEGVAKRFGGDKPLWGPDHAIRTFGEKHWNEPLRWDRSAAKAGVRRRVFCASMADVFEDHGELPGLRARLWELIEKTPNLDWLLLTKRPQNVLEMVPSTWHCPCGAPAEVHPDSYAKFPDNVWIGTSVETQERAAERIPHLLRIPARVRFLSMEPLRGPVDLTARVGEVFVDGGTGDEWAAPLWACRDCGGSRYSQTAPHVVTCSSCSGTGVGIHWVIAGGESGLRARPSHPAWFRDLRDQCAQAGVPFFFKQWGNWAPGDDIEANRGDHIGMFEEHREDGGAPRHSWPDGLIGAVRAPSMDTTVYRIEKKNAGALLDGVEHKEFPA